MKFIYSKMKYKASRNGAVIASFFFNARGEYLERSIFGMYRSLLYQLLKGYPELQDILNNSEIIPPGQDSCPSLNILKEIFFSTVSSLGQRQFTCFIDALDECDEQQVREIVDYFEDLTEQCTKQSIAFRICLSSRHYPYIAVRRGIRLTLEDQIGHSNDLETYIESRLLVKEQDLVEKIYPKLLSKAAGVFMWIVLVVDILNKEYERGGLALQRRLADIPSDLSALFKDILQRDTDNMEALLICLRWILFAKEPLRPAEFYHALWCDLSEKDLGDSEMPDVTSLEASKRISIFVISSSKGLAEITTSDKPTVQFIHESVRDFLIKDRGLFNLWPELETGWHELSHTSLSQCCNRYMSHISGLLNPQNPTIYTNQYPFMEYAIQHVLYHANVAADMIPQNEFLSQFPVGEWVKYHNVFEKFLARKYHRNPTLLYILADKGFANLIRTTVDRSLQFHGQDQRYIYPIFAALANGHKDAVAALLGIPSIIEEGVDITEGLNFRKDLKNYMDRTLLSWASEQGRVAILKSLLKLGVSVNATDGGRGETALSRGVASSREATVRLLIEKGGDVNAVNESGQTPLIYASTQGNEAIIRLLIENGADVNAVSESGQTPLIYASTQGNEAIIRLLLEYGADVNTVSESGETPLSWATKKENEAIARLLIAYGANVYAGDKCEEVEKGKLKIMKWKREGDQYVEEDNGKEIRLQIDTR